MLKKIITCVVLGCALSLPLCASASAENAFIEGCKSFSEGDWDTAEFSLRKAVAYAENQNPDTYYMLITAEMNAGDEKNALDDCGLYLKSFPGSIYYSRVQYQYGKLLYQLGEYEKCIISLSDFCHQNVDDEMYSYALFYIGEALLAGYKYNEAADIYQRIVIDFPDSPKAIAAQYRLDSILQHTREEKLLYLLKQTGEEYLSAKEEYEKQLRLMNMDSATRIRLSETQQRNEELETQLRNLESKLTTTVVTLDDKSYEDSYRAKMQEDYVSPLDVDILRDPDIDAERINGARTPADGTSDAYVKEVDVPSMVPFDETREQIRILKRKAKDAQKLMGGEY